MSTKEIWTRLEQGAPGWALRGFGAFTLLTIAGYATFGVNPQLLAGLPEWIAAFYGVAFRFFSIGHVLFAFGALALLLTFSTGWRWLPAFAAIYLISLGSELLGTNTGLPFGEYAYTGFLGPKWLDDVPIVIPLSWFFMAIPSYLLARLAWPRPEQAAARIGFAAVLLVIWDLALDPAMSYATPYWLWESPGPYYGMPLLNLGGWFVTGLLLMAVLALPATDRWMAGLSVRWNAWFYGWNMALPIGMCLAAGLWGAVALTLVATGICAALIAWRVQGAPELPARSSAPMAGELR